MDRPIVAKLKTMLMEHEAESWKLLLADSISEGKTLAIAQGYEPAMNWPDTLDGPTGYYEYLNKSVVLIPRQNYPKEAFITLWTFYWLLNAPPGKKLQESDEFNVWMRSFANDWGTFLDTPESAAGIQSFLDDPAYCADQYFPVGHYHTFNDFFARDVKPGLRPVADFLDNGIITSPADATYKQQFKIDNENEVTIKYTHKYHQ